MEWMNEWINKYILHGVQFNLLFHFFRNLELYISRAKEKLKLRNWTYCYTEKEWIDVSQLVRASEQPSHPRTSAFLLPALCPRACVLQRCCFFCPGKEYRNLGRMPHFHSGGQVLGGKAVWIDLSCILGSKPSSFIYQLEVVIELLCSSASWCGEWRWA